MYTSLGPIVPSSRRRWVRTTGLGVSTPRIGLGDKPIRGEHFAALLAAGRNVDQPDGVERAPPASSAPAPRYSPRHESIPTKPKFSSPCCRPLGLTMSPSAGRARLPCSAGWNYDALHCHAPPVSARQSGSRAPQRARGQHHRGARRSSALAGARATFGRIRSRRTCRIVGCPGSGSSGRSEWARR